MLFSCFVVALLALGLFGGAADAKQITISNIVPRRDLNGDILRVQDGCLARFDDGLYYLYGARYQCCPVDQQPACYNPCGWYNTTFAVYSSPDLTAWTLRSENIFPLLTDPDSPRNSTFVSYFEPCVMYNRKYRHYVLWFNHPFSKGTAIGYSPTGPFTLVNWDLGPGFYGSDIYFWQDQSNPDDVYAKHNVSPDGLQSYHQVSVLADDWLSIDMSPNASSNAMYPPTYPIPPAYQGNWPNCSEGGGIFQQYGRWYVMFGACCCFCQAGANGYTFVADHPLGPYRFLADTIPFDEDTQHYVTRSQQFSVAPLPTADGGYVPIYVGQRFGSADDKLKCHDYQYWAPLTVDPQSGKVQTLKWIDSFTVDLAVAESVTVSGGGGDGGSGGTEEANAAVVVAEATSVQDQ